MKLKDYEMPRDGSDFDFDQSDLKKYDLKNFDLAQLQAAEAPPVIEDFVAPAASFSVAANDVAPVSVDGWPLSPPPVFGSPVVAPVPAPVVAPVIPPVVAPVVAPPIASAPAPLPPTEEAPSPVRVVAVDDTWGTVLAASAPEAGPAFYGLTNGPELCEPVGLAYNPFSPSPQGWNIPRWFVALAGVFFVSGAALAVTVCVVLLRKPDAAPVVQAPAPTVTVAASAPVAPPAAPAVQAAAEPARAPSAPAVRAAAPVEQRVVASRQTKLVRRQPARRAMADRGRSSGREASETVSARRTPDALDELLGNSTL